MTKNDLYIAVLNQEIARGFVHSDIPQTDLAAVVVERNTEGRSTPLTESNLADMWLTDEEGIEIAQKNTNQDHFICMSVAQALGFDAKAAGIDQKNSSVMTASYSDTPLYVLTNQNGVYGAAAITRPEIMKGITEKFGPVYVLPSSVHEVLILPKAQAPDVESLRAMVHEINMTQVLPEERLSDNIYEISGSHLVITKGDEKTPAQNEGKYEERGKQK